MNEEIMNEIQPVRPKDQFTFSCRQCGACCRNIEGCVMVESLDAYRLARYLRTYEYHAEKLRKIADKLQAGIGYDYDKAVERCKKKRARKSHSSDVGEDALLLTVRAAGKSTDNEKEATPYEEDTPWEPELE